MVTQEGHSQEIEFIQVSDEYNVNESLYTVLDLKHFSKLLSPNFQNSYKQFSTYKNFKDNTVVVEFFGSRKNKLTSHQIDTLHQFIANEENIAETVRENIYNYYESVYIDYLEGATLFDAYSPEIESWLPKIVKGAELDNKVRLDSITIYPLEKNKITLRFWCSWDEEHGLGVLLEGGKVLKVGIEHDVTPPF